MSGFSTFVTELAFEKFNPWSWLRKMSDQGVAILCIQGAPTNGANGTANGKAGPGTLLIDVTNGILYINNGTKAAPFWSSSGEIQHTSGTIASADITGSSAGQLGHAAGVILQASSPNVALQLVSFAMYYTFNTAAYTGGGNLTVNWGGGAALTGVVSAANSLGASSSNANTLYPLAAAGTVLHSGSPLNLVAASAFTQPGTAAGTVAWDLWYRRLPVGF